LCSQQWQSAVRNTSLEKKNVLFCFFIPLRKLETILNTLLSSYLTRYLRDFQPGDLRLSLWGGDVILRNVDLRAEGNNDRRQL